MDSVFVPVLYVVVVFGSLSVFSHFYRKHNASKVFEPYFPTHSERNTYVTLLQKTDPPAHDALLKSALVRRAMTDVNRVIRLREDKPALQNLLQKGSIGDDLWNSLLAAEKELEAEITEVVAEANSFVDGWGTVIFQTASEVIANEKMRSIFDQTVELRAEKEKKYDRKAKNIGIPPPISLLSPGIPNSPAQLVVPTNSPASGKSVVTNGIPPSSSRSTSNGLLTVHSLASRGRFSATWKLSLHL
jgi:translocation protein SEC66